MTTTTRPQIVDIEPTRVDTNQEWADDTIDIDQKPDPTPQRQDAFGNEELAEVKYKVLKWWQGGLLMVSETISLGILSLPAAVAGMGLAPALVVLIGMGLLASYTGYLIGKFKTRYPHISSVADAGEVLMGRFGYELFGTAQLLFLVFIMASHILTFTVALNSITKHATCSIVFGVVGMILSCILSLPRTLEKMSWLSLVSFISILSAVMICMIAVGIRNPESIVHPTVETDLVTGFTSAANIAFSYVSHNTFFTFIAELKDPKDFPKALALLQTVDMTLYIVAAVVIYRYAGADVTSPALGSAGPLVARIAYGVALPTIVIAGVINSHVAAKAIYIRVFAGTDRMHKRDFVAVGSWVGIAAGLWLLAWIIAEAIPVFNNLLSLITALFGSWFTFGFTGIFGLYMDKGLWFASPKKTFQTMLNTFAITVGVVLCVLGLYSSGKTIHDNPGSSSFSCADNQ
ncbi:Amino acid transporter transmembrane [Penicillium citrinum]|uniref:Amino acid transporter transmembrane n=2 Tax=Penicillium TaxID=5073 RepID=A0A9W9TVG4_PENCI|nr:Amino acid transporter transmembrane [Penicillium citrinum]KAJ5242977.1 Amino acid transporter transmembrane [Penicillium citrinum]KAJ5599517.1 Amino acid transporter transmembrane [Penicillium hetheringtonii]